jgi:ATP-dependent DNA ligase
MTSVYGILDRLAFTASRNDKISILEEHKDNEDLKGVLVHALNPYMQYNIKKIPNYDSADHPTVTLKQFFAELPNFSDRTVSGHAAVAHLKHLLESMHPYDAVVAERIIGKDLRCGVAESTVNKVYKDLIPTYPCLLGKAYDEDTIKAIVYPAISQIKADGMRVNVIVRQNASGNWYVTVRGRSGKLVDLLGHLDDSFCNLGRSYSRDVVFDGELIVVESDGKTLDRKTGNGILNKAVKGTITAKEAAKVRVRLWDMIDYDKFLKYEDITPYEDRFSKLVTHVDLTPHILYSIIESKVVNNFKEVLDHFAEAIARGEEGTMLKNLASIWEDKRSKHLIKFKAVNEMELEVTDWQEGTGKYEGMMGALEYSNLVRDLVVWVGTGFSDNDRKQMTRQAMMGTIGTIRYNEIISDKNTNIKSLFLPRFVTIRYDKFVPD